MSLTDAFTGIQMLAPALGAIISAYIAVSKKMETKKKEDEQAAIRLAAIEQAIKDHQMNLGEITKAMKVFNHNSTAIVTALIAAKVLPPEVMKALEDVDI